MAPTRRVILVLASLLALAPAAHAGERLVLASRTTDEVHPIEQPTLCCGDSFLAEVDFADVRLDLACPGGALAVHVSEVRDVRDTFGLVVLTAHLFEPRSLADVPCADAAALSVPLPDLRAHHVYHVAYEGALAGPGTLSFALSGVPAR